jgi:F-type H+-transporting ATPase subunit alpha
VVAIFAGVRGYLDKLDLGRVGPFEAQFLADLKAREPALLDAIRTDREIKPETEKKLIAFLDGFAKSFA